ncbi:GNAT family N-acetyltransferase, partial [Candidatus Sumerlaeota bacterium]|nr:GNAT family N-acetyltransferase [Candidatus Sumerlaeota bacterium]
VHDSPQGSLFTSFTWKKVLENGTPFPQRIFGVFRKNELTGGVVLTEKRQIGRVAALNALLSPYLGFLLPPTEATKISDRISKEHEILSKLTAFLQKRYSQIDLINSPGLSDMRPFIQNRWKTIPRYTYYLDISNLTGLWEKLDGSVRRAIKKAQKSDMHIGVMPCSSKEIFNLLDKSLGKKGNVNPIPRSLVETIAASEEIKDRRVMIGARAPKGELLSVIVCVWDSRRAYYLIAATNPEYLSSGIHPLLIWELAGYLTTIPIKQLDFIGGNIPSIARFKETFNPELITHYRTEKWTSYIFKILKKSGQFIKSLKCEVKSLK